MPFVEFKQEYQLLPETPRWVKIMENAYQWNVWFLDKKYFFDDPRWKDIFKNGVIIHQAKSQKENKLEYSKITNIGKEIYGRTKQSRSYDILQTTCKQRDYRNTTIRSL